MYFRLKYSKNTAKYAFPKQSSFVNNEKVNTRTIKKESMKPVEKELSLERIKELLGNKKLSDETIGKIMIRIKRFCKVAYELYLKRQEPPTQSQVIQLPNEMENESENDFMEAA